MNRRYRFLRAMLGLSLGCSLFAFSLGLQCTEQGSGTRPLDPIAPSGNRPPTILITSVNTPSGDGFVEQGEVVQINWSGEDGEDRAFVRIFASESQTPTTSQEIPISENQIVGPGAGTGSATWDTDGVPVGAYYIFAESDDRTFNPATGVGNRPFRVTSATTVQVAPVGSRPQNDPPKLTFLQPVSNLGLSAEDEVFVSYIYSDTDDAVTVTLLLDKDLNPANDDINNPGDPRNPNTNIIILPSEARRITDLTFGDDPPPPDDPNNPPTDPDSVNIRRNPLVLGRTAPGILPFPGAPLIGEFKVYAFSIDFAKIPVSTKPYYLRATVTDGNQIVHRYAVGSITITRLAEGIVQMSDVGKQFAGATWTGFSTGENLGSDFVGVPDIDGDAIDELMVAGQFASPRNRFQSGAAYLIFGRRKTPFPLDTNTNGIPDVIDGNGDIIDFPPPPPWVQNPYFPAFVGRFGGDQNINSLNSFYRGTTYTMPAPHDSLLPPDTLQDREHPGLTTAGLMSITRVDLTRDGIADLVFGLPFISGPWDHHDDDPGDGSCDLPYNDGYPNETHCGDHNDMRSPRFIGDPIDEGLVIMVDGTNDLANSFRLYTDAGLAGQFDPESVFDDEGVRRFVNDIPQTIPFGMRLRGGWFDTDPPIVSDNEYGHTVAAMPSIDNSPEDEFLVSIPGFDSDRGRIQLWYTNNIPFPSGDNTHDGGFIADDYKGGDPILSLPAWAGEDCIGDDPSSCFRFLIAPPEYVYISGAASGDRFGFAGPAGQSNQDGTEDLLCGAPGADRIGLTDNGVFYVLFTPAGGFGNASLAFSDPPRLEVIGSHNGDAFGKVQTKVRDVNGDGIDDVAFGAESYDDSNLGNVDAGYVGVIYGHRPLTGENGFLPEQVATEELEGVRFLGATSGALAGHDIDSAGDFNRDGFGDLLISSPGEIRTEATRDLNGDGVLDPEDRLGVAYLIFGGTHLRNKTYNLSQVGSPELPGIVFISEFVLGSVDAAPIETVGGVLDVDGDGFDDIILGAPHADFVNTASPGQRRRDAGKVYLIYGNNFGLNRLRG